MNKSNYNIFRALTIILIVIFHGYALTSSYEPWYPSIVQILLKYGGEIGVTAFFILSGFGIFFSLDKTYNSNKRIPFLSFIKKRLEKLYPEYLLCLLVLLFLTSNVVYLSLSHLWHLISHLLLIHNLSPTAHGTINGALWTMGTIFQFYLVAIPLYYAIKKNRYLTIAISIIFTIATKYFIYNYFLLPSSSDSIFYFIFGRQIYTALDNFVLGMFVASLLTAIQGKSMRKVLLWPILLIEIFVLFVWLYSAGASPHNASLIGYTWHSVLALILSAILGTIILLPEQKNRTINHIFSFLNNCQYGIYLWHLPILATLLSSTNAFETILHISPILFMLLYLLISIGAGYISSKFTFKLRFSKRI